MGNANADAYNLDGNRIRSGAGNGDKDPQTFLLTFWNPAANMSAPINAGLNTDTLLDVNTQQAADNNLTIGNIRFRHLGNKQANCLFGDGHAAPFTYKSQYSSDLQRRNVHLDNLP